MKRNESNIKALKRAKAVFEFFASLNKKLGDDMIKRFTVAGEMAEIAACILQDMQERNQTF